MPDWPTFLMPLSRNWRTVSGPVVSWTKTRSTLAMTISPAGHPCRIFHLIFFQLMFFPYQSF